MLNTISFPHILAANIGLKTCLSSIDGNALIGAFEGAALEAVTSKNLSVFKRFAYMFISLIARYIAAPEVVAVTPIENMGVAAFLSSALAIAVTVPLIQRIKTLDLQTGDLVAAARNLAMEVAIVRAVTEVESSASGFLEDGRPVILFARHIFYRRLKVRGIDPEPLATQPHPDVVSRTPGGYKGGAPEYVRLAAAEAINIDAARESASWARFR